MTRKLFLTVAAILIVSLALVVACKERKDKGASNESKTATIQSAAPTNFNLTDDDKKRLLEIARKTLDSYIRDGKIPDFPAPEGALKNAGAAFVTLRKNGELRGCIGHLVAREPLWMCVRDMAVAASTEDPRFPQVRADELNLIDVEVSVLTPPEQVKNISEIQLGKHGVIVKKGFSSGVYLPQVATETGWDMDTFLAHLCADKAGLAPDCYKDPDTAIMRFEAIVFEEPTKNNAKSLPYAGARR